MSLWAYLDLRYEWFRWNWIVSIKRNVNHKFNPEIFGNCCNRQQWFCQWWNKWKLTLVSSRRSFSRASPPLERSSSGPLAKIPGSPLQYHNVIFLSEYFQKEREKYQFLHRCISYHYLKLSNLQSVNCCVHLLDVETLHVF